MLLFIHALALETPPGRAAEGVAFRVVHEKRFVEFAVAIAARPHGDHRFDATFLQITQGFLRTISGICDHGFRRAQKLLMLIKQRGNLTGVVGAGRRGADRGDDAVRFIDAEMNLIRQSRCLAGPRLQRRIGVRRRTLLIRQTIGSGPTISRQRLRIGRLARRRRIRIR